MGAYLAFHSMAQLVVRICKPLPPSFSTHGPTKEIRVSKAKTTIMLGRAHFVPSHQSPLAIDGFASPKEIPLDGSDLA